MTDHKESGRGRCRSEIRTYVTNVILTTKRTPISRKKGRKTHGEQLSLFCIDSDIFLLNWGLKTNQSCKFRVNRPLNVGLDYIQVCSERNKFASSLHFFAFNFIRLLDAHVATEVKTDWITDGSPFLNNPSEIVTSSTNFQLLDFPNCIVNH